MRCPGWFFFFFFFPLPPGTSSPALEPSLEIPAASRSFLCSRSLARALPGSFYNQHTTTKRASRLASRHWRGGLNEGTGLRGAQSPPRSFASGGLVGSPAWPNGKEENAGGAGRYFRTHFIQEEKGTIDPLAVVPRKK